MPLGPADQTERGFEIVRFADRNGSPCSLQVSSLADYAEPGTSAVWLGPEDADPKVMASQAKSLGIQTAESTGWVPYPIPKSVLLNTRVHLSRGQVSDLIEYLRSWLDTGSFFSGEKTTT
jgi:hypothetical protein